MYTEKKLLIGGQALVELGSSRSTEDVDYLVNDVSTTAPFMKVQGDDHINANGHKFFKEIWKMESKNIGPIASAQALAELKAFSFVQHMENGHWAKADQAEFDMKFIARQLGVKGVSIVKKYVSSGAAIEIDNVFKSVNRNA